MNKVLSFFKKMLLGVNTKYLVKSYIISITITTFFIYMKSMEDSSDTLSNTTATSFLAITYVLIACVLFPFATIVWDDLINTIMSGNFIILPLPFMLIWKFIKILTLYTFSPFIAPFGMMYVYFSNGYHKRENGK
ncbi:hypothetical protein ACEOWG_004368 [Bacillus cereus]